MLLLGVRGLGMGCLSLGRLVPLHLFGLRLLLLGLLRRGLLLLGLALLLGGTVGFLLRLRLSRDGGSRLAFLGRRSLGGGRDLLSIGRLDGGGRGGGLALLARRGLHRDRLARGHLGGLG